MKDVEEFCPRDKKDWRKWLEKHHETKDAIWLILYRKKSANFNLSWSDTVDEALCFGWIDSTKKTIDTETYKQYYTKRKPKSNWSRINKDKVKILIEEGLMRDAGHKTIEIAKENGSWTFLDSVEALVVPEDLAKAWTAHKGSLKFYESLSNSAKKMLLYWVVSAKRSETRQKRILEIAENASQGMKPKPFR